MTLQQLIQDERREARAEGWAEGWVEGRIEALVERYLSGGLPLSMAANKCGLSEEEFLEQTKKLAVSVSKT